MNCGLRTTDYGLQTGLNTNSGRYKKADKALRTGYKYGLRYKTRTVCYGLGIKHEQRFYKLNKFSHEGLWAYLIAEKEKDSKSQKNWRAWGELERRVPRFIYPDNVNKYTKIRSWRSEEQKADKKKKWHYTGMTVLPSYRLGKGRGRKEKKTVLQHAVFVLGHPSKY